MLNKPQKMSKEINVENIGVSPFFTKPYVRRSFPFKYDWSEKQFFIYACFCDDLQQFYQDWVEQGKKAGRIQYFRQDENGKLTHLYWCPSNICCESGETLTKENIDVKIGYWTPNIWKPIRKDLS